MKKPFILIFFFAGSSVFAQEIDYAKYIQTGKWFPGFDITSKKIIYYKKTQGHPKEETVEFKPNGKMIHCANVTKGAVDPNGREAFYTQFVCDSNQTYKIENKMMQIRILQEMPNFYKIHIKGETFELIPVKSDAENEQ